MPLPDTLAIATNLRPSTAFTLVAGTIKTVRFPPAPAAGGRTARRTAVAAKRVPRPEVLLAFFQKTDPTAKTPWDILHRCDFLVTLRGAHGEL